MEENYIKLKGISPNKDGDYWQGILDVGYDEWQKHEDWEYGDMLDYVEEKHGSLARLAILLGKYNQEVYNGGHAQYYANGYASEGEDGGNLLDDECLLHDEMIELLEEYGLHESELGSKVHKVFKDFYKLFEVIQEFLNNLDDEYYKINDDWTEFLLKYFKTICSEGKPPRK